MTRGFRCFASVRGPAFVVTCLLLLSVQVTEGSDGGPPPGWTKVSRPRNERRPPATAEEATPRSGQDRLAFIQFGYPGVLSPRVLLPLDGAGRHLAGGGVTFLPELIGLGVEYRYLIVPRRGPSGFAILAGTGANVYGIRDKNRSASPLALDIFGGFIFRTARGLCLGGDLGVIQTGGSGTENPVRAFGIREGLSTGFASFSLGFLF